MYIGTLYLVWTDYTSLSIDPVRGRAVVPVRKRAWVIIEFGMAFIGNTNSARAVALLCSVLVSVLSPSD